MFLGLVEGSIIDLNGKNGQFWAKIGKNALLFLMFYRGNFENLFGCAERSFDFGEDTRHQKLFILGQKLPNNFSKKFTHPTYGIRKSAISLRNLPIKCLIGPQKSDDRLAEK